MKNIFLNTALAHGDTYTLTESSGHNMMAGLFSWHMFLGLSVFILTIVFLIFGIIYFYKRSFNNLKDDKSVKKVYVCPECSYEYENKEWALKCQKWCQEHKSCNLDIIKYGKLGKAENN